jgi:hypothetical protein
VADAIAGGGVSTYNSTQPLLLKPKEVSVVNRTRFDFRWAALFVVVAIVAAAPAIASGVARYAKNAGKVDGLSADELVRANSVVTDGHVSNFRSRGFANIHRIRFDAPVKGVLMLWSGVNAEWDDDSEPGTYSEIVARLTVDRRVAGSPQRAEISRSTNVGTQHIGLSAAIPVKAGPHRIVLQARTAAGEALTYLRGRHTEFLFVPYGPSGTQGSLN